MTSADVLRKIGEALIELANLEEKLPTEEKPVIPAVEETAPADNPTLEDVRKVLAEISRGGKTKEMNALLSKFGAAKLSDVKESDYSELLKAAEEVKNA